MTITYPRPWPAGLGIQKSRFGLSKNEAAFEGPLARQVNTFSHAAGKTDRWEGILTTPVLSAANMRVLAALGVSLGVKNTINLFDPDRVQPASGWNLLTWSEAFDNVDWDLASSPVTVTADAILAPDGNTTADQIDSSGTGSVRHHAFQVITGAAVAGRRYVASVYAKPKDSNTIVVLESGDAAWHGAVFNVSTGAVGITTGIVSTSIESAANGFYRCSIIFDRTGSASFSYRVGAVPSGISNPQDAFDEAVEGNQSAYFWGAQLEEAPAATSYKPTVAGPMVAGASQTGKTLNIDGLLASQTALAGTGDYFQLGNGFHMLLADMDSDGSGAATLDFEPAMRSSPADNAAVTFLRPVLIARLTSPDFFWETGPMKNGSISIAFEEVI